MKLLGVGLIGIAVVAALLAPSFAGERGAAVVATKTTERPVASPPGPRPRGEAVRTPASSSDRDRLLVLLLILGARAPGSER